MQRLSAEQSQAALLARATALAREIAAGDLDRALAALTQLARDCAKRGAPGPIREVLSRLPDGSAVLSAETCYWLGHALLPEEQAAATHWFVLATERAWHSGDVPLAQIGAACALMCDQLGLERHARVPQLAVDYMAQVPADPGASSPHRALLLLGRLCAAYAVRSLELSTREIEDSLLVLRLALAKDEPWPTPAASAAAAVTLLDFAGAFIDLERARDIAVATSGLVADCAFPRLRAHWWAERGWLYASDSDGEVFRLCVQRVDEHAIELDSDSLRFAALRLRCAAALRSGRVDESLALLPAFEQLRRVSASEAVELSRLKAAVLIMGGRGRQALDITSAELRFVHASGVADGNLVTMEMEHAHALAATGDLAAAAGHMRMLAAREYGTARDRLLSYALAYDWQRSGEIDAGLLRQVLETASSAHAFQLLPRDRATLARLCDAGLARDIERDFVCRLIEHRRIDPPPFASAQWPWAVRIETFGAFRLSVRGAPYRPEHKAQDKVLELLKLLVASQLLRRGDAERAWLCQELWPDAEEPKARKALETSVARLRRLLQNDEAILVSEGRVRFAPSLVWSDVAAFAAACSRIKSAHDDSLAGRQVSSAQLRADVAGLLSLYNGPFLQGDAECSWVLGARSQVSRLLRQSLLAFEQVDAGTHPRELLLALERAHVVDPGSEEIAQMLMRHHLEQANHAEALRVYRRTRETIHAELGAAPSPQTEALGQEVFQAVERDATARSRTRH